MALKTVNEESLVALGDAIRGKTGGEEALNFPNGMVDAINGLSTKSGSVLPQVIDGSITKLTEEDFGNITYIRTEAFWQCQNLTDVAMPDTITRINGSAFSGCSKLANLKMSNNIGYLGNSAFGECKKLTKIRLDAPRVPTLEANTSGVFPTTTVLEVPGWLYDEYLNTDGWNTVYKDQLIPYSKYAGTVISTGILEYNSSKTYSINLTNYDIAPEATITSSNPEIVDVMINETNENEIIFSIFSLTQEGSATVEINILGDDNHWFSRQINVMVFAELTPPSYTVEDVGTTYGFELNDDGYYESTNQGKDNTFAYCKINISNMLGYPVYIDCISYGENNYDFGLLSAVNKDLTKDINASNYQYSFKGLSKPTVQTVEYTDAIGDCYITVKYRKDSSNSNNKDSFQFKVRFGE